MASFRLQQPYHRDSTSNAHTARTDHGCGDPAEPADPSMSCAFPATSAPLARSCASIASRSRTRKLSTTCCARDPK